MGDIGRLDDGLPSVALGDATIPLRPPPIYSNDTLETLIIIYYSVKNIKKIKDHIRI